MDNLQVLFVSFLLFSSVYAKSDCPMVSICGNNRFEIRFPFVLEGPQNQNCTYNPDFNLKCNNEGRVILNLPGAGDFYVRDINYLTQQIQLYDPSNCLPKRLIDFQIPSSSVFKAVSYRNYTFLTCSTDFVTPYFNDDVIGCMSDSTISTLATSYGGMVLDTITSMHTCSVKSTVSLPVSWTTDNEQLFSTDLNNDLVLTWPAPPGKGTTKGIKIFRTVALALVIPAITCSMVLTCYICYVKSRDSGRAAAARRNITAGGAAVVPQPRTTIGLDDSTIESYTKVILGESRRILGPNHGICPICLTEYKSKETVRCIPECEHCFHAECIDEWLKTNSTCPVCRNNPSPVHVNFS